jgi:N-acetyl-gamma-glutamyl-phosphate reductase
MYNYPAAYLSHFHGSTVSASITASIIGASGYSGAELFGLLEHHPHVTVGKLFAQSSAGKQLQEVLPRFAKTRSLELEPFSLEAACKSDVVFIALPSGEAMKMVPGLLERGKRVIDLGGDFRIKDPSEYDLFYKRAHAAPQLLGTAVYGLPEWDRTAIASANLVANPGCYPTGAILPLVPLLKEGLIEPHGIAISSLSGVSGAGRSASLDLSFAEVNESVRAYKVGTHQHIPEIRNALAKLSGRNVAMTFVPHLLPITRGIYTTIFASLISPLSAERVFGAYQKYYADAPFVRVSEEAIPEIKHVQHTNFIDIGFRLYPENDQLVIFSVIDNLVKGAAGQAVQNMNLMFGFNETEGLL